MKLIDIKDEDKVKAFNMIIKAYAKDSNLSEFGKDVQNILSFLRDMNEFNKN